MASHLPAVPPALKSIQHYLKAAAEHDKRDPVVAYWCRLYALQTGMKIDSKSKECRTLLVALMDELEKMKQVNKGNEAFTNEVVAQAHVENAALKLFLWADTEDRAARFNKNVVKAFYTSGMLFDVLSVFGELTEEVVHHRKYAKWKAAYIHNCLKNGEVPIPGPQGEDEDFYSALSAASAGGTDFNQEAGNQYNQWPSASEASGPSTFMPPARPVSNLGPPEVHAPPSTPADQSSSSSSNSSRCDTAQGGLKLSSEDLNKAQKLCKWAGSALQYEDVGTAIVNLEKALRLLTTGKE